MLLAIGEIIPAAAVAAVLVVALRNAERDGLEPAAMLRAGTIGLIGALLGGAALAWPAGYSTLGALAGAFLAGGTYLSARGERVLAYADSGAAGVALGYAIIRFACLLEGHCFGTPTTVPWAIAHGGVAVHPTQLYHAALGFVAYLILQTMRDTRLGARTAAALLLYGSGRFVIEFYRADAMPVWWYLDRNQLLCIAMVAGGAVLLRRTPGCAGRQWAAQGG